MGESIMKNFNITFDAINILELEEEYRFNYDPFYEYTDADKIKIIIGGLDITSRRIFLIYSEFKSLEKTANLYRVSKSTINNKVCVVKDIILEDIKKDIEFLLKKYKVIC